MPSLWHITTYLTLCNDEDIDTQIRWGLAEFNIVLEEIANQYGYPKQLSICESLKNWSSINKYIILSPIKQIKFDIVIQIYGLM
jgi:hypothetical protein